MKTDGERGHNVGEVSSKNGREKAGLAGAVGAGLSGPGGRGEEGKRRVDVARALRRGDAGFDLVRK